MHVTAPTAAVPEHLDSSVVVSKQVLSWVEAARERGIAIRVLEAETGHGKTYVAQSLFDKLADRSAESAPCYWKRGLAPDWPQTSTSDIEEKRKTVIPPPRLRSTEFDDEKRLGFVWIGLPLGASPARVNDVTQFLDQLQAIDRDLIEIRSEQVKSERKSEAFWEAGKRAVTWAAGFVLPGLVVDFFSAGGDVRAIVEEVREAYADPTEKHVQAARDFLLEVLARIRRYANEDEVPLVIVLDDAHAASPEVLELVGLLSGLNVGSGETDDDARNDINPIDENERDSTSNATWLRPDHGLPILVVATTWPDESRLRTGIGFDDWLDKVSKNLPPGVVETISIGPISIDDASELLTKSKFPPEHLKTMCNELGERYDGKSVNAWVLTYGRAAVNGHLGGVALAPKLDDEVIRKLPKDPTFGIEQRLDALSKQGGDYQIKSNLLDQLAAWGNQVPMSLVDALKEEALKQNVGDINSEELLAILENHRMIARPEPEDRPQLLKIDVDIQRYIQRYIADTDKDDRYVRAAARNARNRVLEQLQDEYETPKPWARLAQVGLIVRRAADLDKTSVQGDVFDAMAWRLGGPPWPPNPSVGKRAMLTAVATSGRSRPAAVAAAKLAKLHSDSADKIRILTPHAERSEQVAIRLADLHSDPADKIRILTPHAKRNPKVRDFIAKPRNAL